MIWVVRATKHEEINAVGLEQQATCMHCGHAFASAFRRELTKLVITGVRGLYPFDVRGNHPYG